jgi:hypothetical protein
LKNIGAQLTTVDVILPISRVGKELRLAVTSVIESRGVDTRIIAVDNTSQHSKYIKSLLRKSDIYLEESEQGYVQAMNTPLRHKIAFNEYIAIMNDDDLISADRLQLQVSRLRETKSEVCIAEIHKYFRHLRILSGYGVISYEYWTPMTLLFGYFGADATLLSTREWFVAAGLRDSKIHPDLVDLEYVMRNFPGNRVCAIKGVHYRYQQHKVQMSKHRAQAKDLLLLKNTVTQYLEFHKFDLLTFEDFCFMFPIEIELLDKVESRYENISMQLEESMKDEKALNSHRLLLEIRRAHFYNNKMKIIELSTLSELQRFKSNYRF